MAVWATMEEAILSPRAHMACAGGPRNVMPCLCRSSGSLGFSEAWPHPAHTAWERGRERERERGREREREGERGRERGREGERERKGQTR